MNEQIIILKYEKVSKNKTIGYVDVLLPKLGIEIRRISHLENEGKQWFNFPFYKEESPTGEHTYNNYLKFSNESHQKKFFELLSSTLKEYLKKDENAPKDEMQNFEDLPF